MHIYWRRSVRRTCPECGFQGVSIDYQLRVAGVAVEATTECGRCGGETPLAGEAGEHWHDSTLPCYAADARRCAAEVRAAAVA